MEKTAEPRVLVVEDEFLIRLTLTEALSDEGFSVLEAETADKALPILQDGADLDLLVTDIQLPGVLDGYALVDAMREHRPTLPVIFMTGRPDQGSRAKSPFEVFISKPYTLDEICTAAKRLMTAKKA